MDEDTILGLYRADLVFHCKERGLPSSGNMRILRYRLRKMYGHTAPDKELPPGGTAAEHAAARFNTPGNSSYGISNYIITTGKMGSHIKHCYFAHHLQLILIYPPVNKVTVSI